MSYVYGASQQRAVAEGLLHDLVQERRSLGQVERLSDAPGEVLKALDGAASGQGLIATARPRVHTCNLT